MFLRSGKRDSQSENWLASEDKRCDCKRGSCYWLQVF
jgi:hypothetical protein